MPCVPTCGHLDPITAHECLHESQTDSHGIMPTARVCTEMLPSAFIATAQTEGITLYEPFGGLCAGLEMVLRNGFVVRRWHLQ